MTGDCGRHRYRTVGTVRCSQSPIRYDSDDNTLLSEIIIIPPRGFLPFLLVPTLPALPLPSLLSMAAIFGAASAAQQRRLRLQGRAQTYRGTYIQQTLNREVHAASAYPATSGTYIQQSLYRERSREPALSSVSHSNIPLRQERPLHGAAMIACVPLVVYRRSDLRNGDTTCDEECSICLTTFVDGDCLRVPSCGHCFHSRCLRTWFRTSEPHCPFCRHPIAATDRPCPVSIGEPLSAPHRLWMFSRLARALRFGRQQPDRVAPGIRGPWPFLDAYLP